MVEHRKGLNRTLFWLYSGQGKWPSAFRWAMLVFDLITIALFLVHPLVSWHDGKTESTGVWLYVDIFIVVAIALDFLARLFIERDKLRFFLRPTNLADLLVLATFVVPVFAQNLIFLRVLRVVRLVRAYEYLDQKHTFSQWLHLNSFVVSKVVNLVVFIFIMTAVVYVSEIRHNERIGSYLDALYFTVTSLTTTGYGDIILTGPAGRWISITVMVLGVTLFLQLIRAVAIGDKVRRACPACSLSLHDRDAAHCKRCGADLFAEREEASG
ncbi:MAG TPA: potassium channel family protein [Hyphomonadaceae bacterium]|nr:potassium channel family protein [Hyphomonadaceae bacterium]